LEVFLDRAYPDFLLRAASDDHVIRLSVERAACRSSKPRVSTGNPGERSGEICGVGPDGTNCRVRLYFPRLV
jgi:hypothetical protein